MFKEVAFSRGEKRGFYLSATIWGLLCVRFRFFFTLGMARKFENSKNAKNSQRNKGTGNIIVCREEQTHVVWLLIGSAINWVCREKPHLSLYLQ